MLPIIAVEIQNAINQYKLIVEEIEQNQGNEDIVNT